MTKKSEREILDQAMDRFSDGAKAGSENLERAIDALEFYNGDQWDEDSRRFREDDDRICLTINQIPAFVRQVVNDMRKIRPRIKVKPVGGSDKEVAGIYDGMVRAIEDKSNAKAAYDWAGKRAVICGRGMIRVTLRYVGDSSFKQEIKIKRIKNDFTVILDPAATELNGSDMRWAFVVEDVPRDELEERYPDAGTFDAADMLGLSREGWWTEETARVAEYWAIEERSEPLSLMPDGSLVEGDVEGAVAVRQVKRKKVIQRLITSEEVLEETVFPGQFIPLIPVHGDEMDIEGETILKGMTYDLMDSQRLYNFGRSVEAEVYALTPKAPWIGPEGTFESSKWVDSNRRNYPFLEYVDKGAPPSKAPPAQASPGAQAMMQMSVQEFKSISGIHDAGMGQPGNELAGVAIQQRRVEADTSNFHFVDNLAQSIAHVGKIVVGLIPSVYSQEQLVSIVEPDGTERDVVINGQAVDQESGKPYYYDMTLGEYDVSVSSGPGVATQREDATKGMLEMMKINPQFGAVLGDMLAKMSDWPEADQVAERLKLLLPPDIAKGENPQIAMMMKQAQQQIQQIQQQSGQQMQQMQQYITTLTRQLEDKQRELDIKAAEVTRKAEADKANLAVDMTKLEIDANKNVPGSMI